jgi:hypothetical protein
VRGDLAQRGVAARLEEGKDGVPSGIH